MRRAKRIWVTYRTETGELAHRSFFSQKLVAAFMLKNPGAFQSEIFHVLYRDEVKKAWKIEECPGEDVAQSWQSGNPGARKVRFVIQPKSGSGNASFETLAAAKATAKPGDTITPKVDGPSLPFEAVNVLYSLET